MVTVKVETVEVEKMVPVKQTEKKFMLELSEDEAKCLAALTGVVTNPYGVNTGRITANIFWQLINCLDFDSPQSGYGFRFQDLFEWNSKYKNIKATEPGL